MPVCTADDSLYLGRAHSLGNARQLLNLIGFAVMVNSLATSDLALHSRLPHSHSRQADRHPNRAT